MRSRLRPATMVATASVGAALCLAAASAGAQDAAGLADDPNPYTLGVREALVHDSNVYRIPAGPADTYSTTSLLGSFDQSIGRQRVFGAATVGANRYFDQSRLDNTSYFARAGAQGSTLARLSGDLSAAVGQALSAPAASTGSAQTEPNLARTGNLIGNARWGGDAQLTLEGNAGYSKIDYSLPASASSDASETRGGLSAFYRPGGALKIGLGARTLERRTPHALGDVPEGENAANDVRANTVEFLFDYDRGGWLRAAGNIGYTKQTNSNPVVRTSNFSGVTGLLDLDYLLTGKITARLLASRDASLGTALQTFAVGSTTPGNGGSAPASPAGTTPYENSEITNAVGLGLTYLATAKISASLGGRYSRATLQATAADTNGGDADVQKTAYLGVAYDITRNWSATCRFDHLSRHVSGSSNFSYVSNAIGCSAQFTLR